MSDIEPGQRNQRAAMTVVAAMAVTLWALWGSEAEPASFRVEVHGEGPPMLLIPGLSGSGEVWESVVEHYEDRHQLHVLTLAGFAGEAPADSKDLGGSFLRTVRNEIVGYLQAEELEAPILMGHSLGGFMALWVAASAPDRVGGVVSVDGVAFYPSLFDPRATAEGSREQAEMVRTMFAGFSPQQLAQQGRMAAVAMVESPTHVERVVSWSQRSDPTTVGNAMAELLTTDIRQEIAAIEAPVLLLGAVPPDRYDESRDAMEAAYRAQVEAVPDHRVVLARSRHFVMFDAPEFLLATIDEFMQQAGLRATAEDESVDEAATEAGR